MIESILLKPFGTDLKLVSSAESSNNKVTVEHHACPADFSPYFNHTQKNSAVKPPLNCQFVCQFAGSWGGCHPPEVVCSDPPGGNTRYYVLFGWVSSHFVFAPENCITLTLKSDGAIGVKKVADEVHHYFGDVP